MLKMDEGLIDDYIRSVVRHEDFATLHNLLSTTPGFFPRVTRIAVEEEQHGVVVWLESGVHRLPLVSKQVLGVHAARLGHLDVLRFIDVKLLAPETMYAACSAGQVHVVDYLIGTGWEWDKEFNQHVCAEAANTNGHEDLTHKLSTL